MAIHQTKTLNCNQGVYFLANDSVIDNVIAFLNSFRENNPDIALRLVPYDDSIEHIVSLQSEYNFSVWRSDQLFQKCDEISMQFHGKVFGHYRKLALWEGPFEEFIYIDTDTVILEKIDFVFQFLASYSFIASHSNVRSIRKWVWKDSVEKATLLTREQISFAANTGFFSSKRGNLSVTKALKSLPRALALVEHMELLCIEQPFLNYLVVTSDLPFTSLSTLFLELRSDDVALERWGGSNLGLVVNGRIISPCFPRTLLVHWAGEWKRASLEGSPIRNEDLWKHYRYLRATDA